MHRAQPVECQPSAQQAGLWLSRSEYIEVNMVDKLSQNAIETSLAALNQGAEGQWRIQDGKLHREFKFANFIAAFGFMTQVAMLAERANHHPEWSNVYSTVVIDLTTHDAGGLSEKDFALAEEISQLA